VQYVAYFARCDSEAEAFSAFFTSASAFFFLSASLSSAARMRGCAASCSRQGQSLQRLAFGRSRGHFEQTCDGASVRVLTRSF
jgi:hypothetical protein